MGGFVKTVWDLFDWLYNELNKINYNIKLIFYNMADISDDFLNNFKSIIERGLSDINKFDKNTISK